LHGERWRQRDAFFTKADRAGSRLCWICCIWRRIDWFLSGGSTADIDTIAELETAIGGTNLIASTEIDTLSELNSIVGDGDLVPQSFTLTIAGTSNEITSSAGAQDLSTNRTWTLSLPSTIDLGGKTSFEIPNAAAPTVDAFGEIAGDNNLWAASRAHLSSSMARHRLR
jgi:hypothetical protein